MNLTLDHLCIKNSSDASHNALNKDIGEIESIIFPTELFLTIVFHSPKGERASREIEAAGVS